MTSYGFNDEQKLDVRSNFLDLLDNDVLQTLWLFFEYLSPLVSLFFCIVDPWSSIIVEHIESSCICYDKNYVCVDNIDRLKSDLENIFHLKEKQEVKFYLKI